MTTHKEHHPFASTGEILSLMTEFMHGLGVRPWLHVK